MQVFRCGRPDRHRRSHGQEKIVLIIKSTIREFSISNNGLSLGEPLTHFHGVLRGVPTYSGEGSPLLGDKMK